jgi:hypothetical protein
MAISQRLSGWLACAPSEAELIHPKPPAAHSVGASPAAPIDGIRKHEQVQTGEQEQREREQRQEAHPGGILPACHGDAVDDDGHRKDNGQPAVGLPNPLAPVQWDLLISRLLSPLRRPVGRFNTELLGVLRVQPLPAAELHRLTAGDAGDGSSAEKAIQNIETNVPPGSTH